MAESAQMDENPPGSMLRAWLGLAVLFVLTILSYTDRTIILLLVEPIKADLGIDDVQFSLLTGLSFAALYALFGVPFGWLADRYSRRWIVYLGVSVWSLATAACGLATNFTHLFLARMGVGVGEATLSPVGYAMVGDMFPRRRLAMAIGILASGTVIGAAFAYSVGGLLVQWAEAQGGLFGLRPWQTAIMMVALPGLLIAPLVFIVPRHADRSVQPSAAGVDAHAGGHLPGYVSWLRGQLSHLLPMTFGAAMIYALMFGVTAWMPALLFREYGMSPAEAGGMLGLSLGFSGAIGFVLSGWIVDRLAASNVRHAHLKYTAGVIAVLGIVGLAAFGLDLTSTQVLILLSVLALVSPVNGPVMAYLQMHTPAAFRGRTIALFLLVYNLFGMTVGPTAVALASQEIYGDDIAAGMATLSIVAGILGTVLLIRAWRREPEPAAQPD